ncbi:MAG TPA: WD40 repeat domain-containing protein [Hyphomicrobiales bacterium]|nr:WD40 repeat domain-containing protein [Hyphomicrobiales bacterium]
MFGLKKPAYAAKCVLLDQLPDYPVAADWSADDTRLALAAADGSIHVYSPEYPERTTRWQAHDGCIQALRWHPTLPLLSSGGQDGRIRHWSFDTAGAPQQHAESPRLGNWIEDMAWHPEGRYLAVTVGREALLFDHEGYLHNRVDFETSTIAGLAWHPRGTALALAGYGGVMLVSGVADRPTLCRLAWHGSLLNCLWSPDGKVLAACRQDNAIHFWRLKTQRDSAISGYDGKPRAMAFSADSRYLVTGGSERLTAWKFVGDGPEGRPPLEMLYHQSTVTTLCLHPDTGHVAAGDKSGVVSLWEAAGSAQPYYHFALASEPALLSWRNWKGRQLLAVADQNGRLELLDIRVA